METILTVTEASRNFADVVNRAYYRHEATTLLKNGKPVARVVPMVSAVPVKIGPEIAAWLAGKHPMLGVKEAEAFEADLQTAKAELREPVSPWD